MRDLYKKTGQGFLLVFSITSASSLIELGNLREEIIREVDECGQDVQEALKRVAKFSAIDTLGDGVRARAARTRYKLEWRFSRRDEVQTARQELMMATQRLTTLLVISNACVLPSIFPHSKL